MPHLNPKGIDLVVSMFVVNPKRGVILLHHKKLGGWFPPGGHVELTWWPAGRQPGEDSDEALFRELEEETGLTRDDVTVTQFGSAAERIHNNLKPLQPAELAEAHNTRQLLVPWKMDLHDFPPVPGHRHLALIYLLRTTKEELRLEADKADDIRWFTFSDLELTHGLLPTVRRYAMAALAAEGDHDYSVVHAVNDDGLLAVELTGPFHNQRDALETARDMHEDGEFDVRSQNVYLLHEHTLEVLEDTDLGLDPEE